MYYEIKFLVNRPEDVTEKHFKEWVKESLLLEGVDMEKKPLEFAVFENYIKALRIKVSMDTL